MFIYKWAIYTIAILNQQRVISPYIPYLKTNRQGHFFHQITSSKAP